MRSPASDGLIGYVEPTLGEEILDVSIAERETQIEPACWMTTGGKRWRRYEISAITSEYLRPRSRAGRLP
jgi:hypothetical protein